MSGLAAYLAQKGNLVSGSDASGAAFDFLIKNGVAPRLGLSSKNIPDGVDVFVYTHAISPNEPEFKAALDSGARLIERSELLGEIILKDFKNSVAVAGVHGKTTTTSMVAEVLGILRPTVFIGGHMKPSGLNALIGDELVVVAEACEYRESFLNIRANIGVILNIEADHPDFYKDLEHMQSSFAKFALNLPKDGALIINSSCEKIETHCPVISFGKNGDFSAFNITQTENEAKFDIKYKEKLFCQANIAASGEYNIQNALAAAAVGYALGLEAKEIARGLENWTGVARRFEFIGKYGDIPVYDDYAHHPTEIKACLSRLEHKNIVACFQSHTYSRTLALLDEFAKALSICRRVIIAPIFAAREKIDDPKSVALKLTDALKKIGVQADFAETFDDAHKLAKQILLPNDVFISVGAGDVYKVARTLAEI